MSDREWRASHCIECVGTDPDEGWHERCGCHETPAATTESGPRTDRLRVRKTAPGECANTAEGLTDNDAVGVEVAGSKRTPKPSPTGGPGA